MSLEVLIFLALVCLLAGWVHGALGLAFRWWPRLLRH